MKFNQESWYNSLMKNEDLTPKQIVKGIMGIAKATMGIDKTLQELYIQRLKICNNCDFCIKNENKIKCGKCGCNLKLKAKINSEECPIGKW